MNLAKLITVGEKARYPFKSYPRHRCDTLLFPGCSFPSQLPRTMNALSQLCREAGFGVAYDCCGYALEGFDEQGRACRVVKNVAKRLERLGVKRLVLVCPNCQAYFAGKLDCELVSVFDVFDELGVEGGKPFGAGCLFIPCPDKRERALETKLREVCDLTEVRSMERVGCCGLRPDIALRGPERVRKFSDRAIEAAAGQTIYTYCASCLGQFGRVGYRDCRHVVSVALGIDEAPDYANALANRAKRKFDRNTDPIRCADAGKNSATTPQLPASGEGGE